MIIMIILGIFLFTSCYSCSKPTCTEEQSEKIAVKSQMSQIK